MVDIRETREIVRIPGIGGFLGFRWPGRHKGDFAHKIEVDQWELWHRFTNVRIPQSGGKGAVAKRRVSTDFTFTAAVQFDASYLLPNPAPLGGTPGDNTLPFMEEKLGGEGVVNTVPVNFMVSLVFQIGDPGFYDFLDLPTIARPVTEPSSPHGQAGSYLRCDEVLLQEVYTLNKTGATSGVVRLMVKGEGAARLERFIGPNIQGAGMFRPQTESPSNPVEF